MATGVNIRVEVHSAEVEALLARIAAVGADATPFMREVGQYLLSATERRFETARGPGGVPWQRLSKRTARERIKKGYGTTNILKRSGDLKNSIAIGGAIVTADSVEIGTNVPYAAIQQFGGTIKREAHTQTIYQHYDAKSDTFDQRFRKKEKSNFARDVAVGAYEITIPARPYLGIDAEDAREIEAIGEAFLAKVAGGAP